MESLLNDWNSSTEDRAVAVQKWNQSIEQDYKDGKISAEAVIAGILPVPEKIKPPTPAWVRWWKASWGWSMLSRSGDTQGWLPFAHEDMCRSREQTRQLLAEGCHKFLCLNYDQLWRSAWNMGQHRLCFKDRQFKGKRVAKRKVTAHADKKVHHVKGSRRSITDSLFQINLYVFSGLLGYVWVVST